MGRKTEEIIAAGLAGLLGGIGRRITRNEQTGSPFALDREMRARESHDMAVSEFNRRARDRQQEEDGYPDPLARGLSRAKLGSWMNHYGGLKDLFTSQRDPIGHLNQQIASTETDLSKIVGADWDGVSKAANGSDPKNPDWLEAIMEASGKDKQATAQARMLFDRLRTLRSMRSPAELNWADPSVQQWAQQNYREPPAAPTPQDPPPRQSFIPGSQQMIDAANGPQQTSMAPLGTADRMKLAQHVGETAPQAPGTAPEMRTELGLFAAMWAAFMDPNSSIEEKIVASQHLSQYGIPVPAPFAAMTTGQGMGDQEIQDSWMAGGSQGGFSPVSSPVA